MLTHEDPALQPDRRLIGVAAWLRVLMWGFLPSLPFLYHTQWVPSDWRWIAGYLPFGARLRRQQRARTVVAAGGSGPAIVLVLRRCKCGYEGRAAREIFLDAAGAPGSSQARDRLICVSGNRARCSGPPDVPPRFSTRSACLLDALPP